MMWEKTTSPWPCGSEVTPAKLPGFPCLSHGGNWHEHLMGELFCSKVCTPKQSQTPHVHPRTSPETDECNQVCRSELSPWCPWNLVEMQSLWTSALTSLWLSFYQEIVKSTLYLNNSTCTSCFNSCTWVQHLHIITSQETGKEMKGEAKESFSLPFNGRNSGKEF